MALTITRRCAQQLRTVLRRAFGRHGPGPALCITAVAGTLSVRASVGDIAVEYRQPNLQPAEAHGLPFQFLDDCEDKTDEPVEIQASAEGRITRPARPPRRDLASLIQQAETLRAALRETLVKTGELLKGLKVHRRQSRAVQNTLASLRQLKTIGV